MFGGKDDATNATLGDTWIFDGDGWQLVTPPSSPEARIYHGMTYDRALGAVVLFGGLNRNDIALNDTWAWDGHTWKALVTPIEPSPRYAMAMTYDAAHQDIVMFGGRIPANPNGPMSNIDFDHADTWTFDGKAWTQRTPAHVPSGHGGRSFAAITYDSKRSKVVLFGGSSYYIQQLQGSLYDIDGNDVWEYDGTDWTKITAANPPGGREKAMLAYDPVTERVMLFGGAAQAPPTNDVWFWNGSTWSQYTNTGRPEARDKAMMVGDTAHHQVVLFGGDNGTNGATPRPGAREWTWNGSTWATKQTIPPPISNSVVAFDTQRRRAVAVTDAGTTWESTGTSWKSAGTIPINGAAFAMEYDRARGVTVLVEPNNAANQLDTWTRADAAWSKKTPATSPPAWDFTALAAGPSNTLVLFGGLLSSVQDDTWIWDGVTWTMAHPAHRPPARSAPMLAYDPIRNRTVLFGGLDADGSPTLADTWLWDGTDWTEATTSPSPAPRVFGGFAWQPDRKRLLLFGGLSNAAWEWDGAGWSTITAPSAPFSTVSPLVFPTSDGTGMIVLGGYTSYDKSSAPVADAALLRWDNATSTESCAVTSDVDGDMKKGCADEDCWWTCAPTCEPGTSCNTSASPRCGDGTCGAAEACWSCPADCGACP